MSGKKSASASGGLHRRGGSGGSGSQGGASGSNKKRTSSGGGRKAAAAAADSSAADQSEQSPSPSPQAASTSSGAAASPSPVGASSPSASPPIAPYSFESDSTLDIVLAVALLCVPVALIALHVRDHTTQLQIACNALLSVAAYFAVVKLIPIIKHYTMKRNMSGKDLNKPGRMEDKPAIPESQGVVSGVIYVIVIIFLQLAYARDNRLALVEYNAALHSIGFMIFLGFADDVVDLPWRYKLILPTIGTLPLLVAYSGSTYIAVPWPLVQWMGGAINLGMLYQVYMGLLAVFCTNAINIYAGLNGLEAGQSFVIGVSILMHNIVELNGPFHTNHLFSIFLIVPFIAVTLGLLRWNWYPSQVFVGDTFCYFAGMTFAVVGILGHFSKTLLLFFIPQIINFLYSLPQILQIWGIKCPRHRLPRYNAATDKLEAIPTNHNLINLFLLIVGPQHERTLCRMLLALQIGCSILAFFIRYTIAAYFYTHTNTAAGKV